MTSLNDRSYEPADNEYLPVPLADSHPYAMDLAVAWLTWHEETAESSPKTVGSYAYILRAWLAFCEDKKINPLMPTIEELESFPTRPRVRLHGRKGSPHTQAMDVKVLSGFYEWAAKRNKLHADPTVDLRLPKLKTRNPKPIEDHDWQIIWASEMPYRLRAVLGLGYYAGLRRAELQSLRCEQIGTDLLRHVIRKGNVEQNIPWADMAETIATNLPHLLPDVSVLASAIRRTENNYERLSPYQTGHSLWRRMRQLCVDLGIEHNTVHRMRHSTATNLIDAGVPHHLVQTLMNHSSINTTMLYVRSQASDLRKFLDLKSDKRG